MKYLKQFVFAMFVMSTLVWLSALGGMGYGWAENLAVFALVFWFVLNALALAFSVRAIVMAEKGELSGGALAAFMKRVDFWRRRPVGLTWLLRTLWTTSYLIIVSLGWVWSGGLLLLFYWLNVMSSWVSVELADKMGAKAEAMS